METVALITVEALDREGEHRRIGSGVGLFEVANGEKELELDEIREDEKEGQFYNKFSVQTGSKQVCEASRYACVRSVEKL